MKLLRTWARVHANGRIAVVDELQLLSGKVVYAAGALGARNSGALRFNFQTVRAAKAYADAHAREQGHACSDRCGFWIAAPEEPHRVELPDHVVAAIERATLVVGGITRRLRFVSAVSDPSKGQGHEVSVIVETVHTGRLVRAVCPISPRDLEDVALVVRMVLECMRSALNEATGTDA